MIDNTIIIRTAHLVLREAPRARDYLLGSRKIPVIAAIGSTLVRTSPISRLLLRTRTIDPMRQQLGTGAPRKRSTGPSKQ